VESRGKKKGEAGTRQRGGTVPPLLLSDRFNRGVPDTTAIWGKKAEGVIRRITKTSTKGDWKGWEGSGRAWYHY